MTLLFKVENLDNINEELHDLYEKTDDGYQLSVEGLEDTGALKRAKDYEKDARKKAEARLKEISTEYDELRSRLEAADTDKYRKKGDIEALEKSWNEKLTKREAELSKHIESLTSMLNSQMVTSVANQLANELAVQGSAAALLPHIERRLQMETRDNKPVTIVLDNEGMPSALTVEELKQEIANNPVFSPLIVGSKASGSGASGGTNGGATKKINFTTATPSEIVKYMKAKTSH